MEVSSRNVQIWTSYATKGRLHNIRINLHGLGTVLQHMGRNFRKKVTLQFKKGIFLNKLFSLIADLFALALSWFGAYWLRFSFEIPPHYVDQAINLFPWIFGIETFLLLLFRLDRIMPRFTSLSDATRIGFYCFGASSSSAIFVFIFNHSFQGFPRSIPVLQFLLLFTFTAGWRILPRILHEQHYYFGKRGKRALIVGAGQAGEMLARDMLRQSEPQFHPVGFVDDDRHKKGRLLHGLSVLGLTRQLPEIVKKYRIETVILAIPSADRKIIRRLTGLCEQAGVKFHTLPSTSDLISGRVRVSDLREVTIEDLLGREPVKIDQEAIAQDIEGQTILVTGAGGSIGSELCRQIAGHNPRRLLMLDASEYNLYALSSEMEKGSGKCGLTYLLGDIRNKDWIIKVLSEFKPSLIFHAAAYKHVPMVEHNPAPGIDNNINGTISLADAAHDMQVKKFIMVSTDKAVNPTNVMGATKRIAEIYCQNLNRMSGTAFITTRFGNVLNSSGSVIPLFRKQIADGGPVTVTHPDIERYFMTIPEACQLVLQAASMGKGGEIFVLDMGEPVKIRVLAQQLIKLSGYEPGTDIPIEYIGLRPGEKLYEELFHPSEKLKATGHPKILLARSCEVEWIWFKAKLKALDKNLYSVAPDELKKNLWTIIPEYRYQKQDRRRIDVEETVSDNRGKVSIE